MHSLDHVHEETELEDQAEQALAKTTNPELAQDKPLCIPPIILGFPFNHYLYAKFDCALSCRN
jgi:hypothetical protein